MQDENFPALYRSANAFSLESQRNFFRTLRFHLCLLIFATFLSIVSIPHWSIAVLQLLALLGALCCSIYLFNKRPERYWYAGRAVAESVKTITWRYVCRAEPFQGVDATARIDFQERLRAIVDQNTDIVQAHTNHLGAPQITDVMAQMRARPLEERKTIYANSRINDQLSWYTKKAAFNKNTANGFFWALIVMNGVAVLCAILRIVFINVPFWPTDIFVAAAASLLSWMQAKRFSELAASYALTAYEIGLIREQSLQPITEEEFSLFVGDAENAFSREHTQWVARRDV
jgi:SMODS and SLOG-associating 2TM effector domain 3/SMODS and SLOG-associating 2TM effector domain 1